MKWKDSGAPYYQKDSQGRWRLHIPGDFEFESDDEREAMGKALETDVEEKLKRLLGAESN